jgi:hypothetical protein
VNPLRQRATGAQPPVSTVDDGALFEESRSQFIGQPANLKLSFLALVARLFGEEEAKRVDREIR